MSIEMDILLLSWPLAIAKLKVRREEIGRAHV